MATLDRPSPEFERRLREIERKILGSPLLKNHQHLLEKIVHAGMTQKNLIRALAMVVTHHESSPAREWWREEIRNAIDSCERLSKRLETTAELANEVTKNPFCRIAFWRALIGGPGGPNLAQSTSAVWTISGMRQMAESSRLQARALGRFLRKASRKDDRFPVVYLLSLIRAWTKQDFDEELSTLLDDAFKAVGKTPPLSIAPESLRQLRSRYLSHQS